MPNPTGHLVRVPGLGDVGRRDAGGEERSDQAPGHAGVVHLLHHRHHVDDVPTAAANPVGEAEADQAEIPGEAVQRAR